MYYFSNKYVAGSMRERISVLFRNRIRLSLLNSDSSPVNILNKMMIKITLSEAKRRRGIYFRYFVLAIDIVICISL